MKSTPTRAGHHAPDAPREAHAPTTTALWAEFRDSLHRFLRARLPSEADADDVLQDVFLRIHEGADRLGAVRHARGWLFAIAQRALADFYRARSRRPDLLHGADDADETSEDAGDTPPDNLSAYHGTHDVHEEVLSWLVPLIDELPEPYRVPLRMADVEGRTQQEVADALGLSLSGAKSRVQRGRALLGELLQRCCAVEFGAEGRAVAFRRLRPPDDPCEDDGCAG